MTTGADGHLGPVRSLVGTHLAGGRETLDPRWVPLDQVVDVDGPAPWLVPLLPHLRGERAVFRAAEPVA